MKKYKFPCYVLASKYRDGDTKDRWGVGYLKSINYSVSGKLSYDVCNDRWESLSFGHYSRIVEITKEEGEWLLNNTSVIEQGDRSVFSYLRFYRQYRVKNIDDIYPDFFKVLDA
jgi:hypothetical protein